jgi:fructan beta-fructosidase
MPIIRSLFAAVFLFSFIVSTAQTQTTDDPYRPQIHFTPPEHWMNDPNGLVYYKGTYHLFYQYYPGGTVWGPMHWGHATSSDLIHWKHQQIALYPDSLGYIFSGSAVVDSKNTSGFGKNGTVPLVAIFTHHDPKGEKEGKDNFQNQSLAYSLDQGMTWTKYAHNPVLKNPGIKDFRDPKVSWNEVANKWIMTLAVLDHINFYSSPDLKNWTKEGEFGKDLGAHGGVWECPDLFSLNWQGKKVWVLIVNLNPGGPNEGSATQYFVGKFDGRQFTSFDKETRWLDYGPDEYAGITYSNTGNRKIFLGWMSNWLYGQQVPTEKWRSAMTIPRELSLVKTGKGYLVASKPIMDLGKLAQNDFKLHNVSAKHLDITSKSGKLKGPAQLKIATDNIEDFSITLSNSSGQKLVIGFDKTSNNYFIDRRSAGKVDFAKGFAARHTAPRLASGPKFDLTLLIDDASVELFADNGLTVMTEISFPDKKFSDIVIESAKNLQLKDLQLTTLRSIYK